MKIRNLMRARRIRKLRSRLEDQEHINWAESLVIPSQRWSFDPIDGFPYPPDKPVVIHDTDIQSDGLDVGPWHSNYERFS